MLQELRHVSSYHDQVTNICFNLQECEHDSESAALSVATSAYMAKKRAMTDSAVRPRKLQEML